MRKAAARTAEKSAESESALRLYPMVTLFTIRGQSVSADDLPKAGVGTGRRVVGDRDEQRPGVPRRERVLVLALLLAQGRAFDLGVVLDRAVDLPGDTDAAGLRERADAGRDVGPFSTRIGLNSGEVVVGKKYWARTPEGGILP